MKETFNRKVSIPGHSPPLHLSNKMPCLAKYTPIPCEEPEPKKLKKYKIKVN